MLRYPAKEICNHIDFLFRNLQLSRSVLPYITNSMEGQIEIKSPGYYKAAGYRAKVIYEKPLTIERIINLNEASDSINQGFIIRLCAYLEYCKVYEPCIDKKIDGNLEIVFIKKLRNVFAHTSGVYNEKDNKQKKLRNRMIEYFHIPAEELVKIETKFPISINDVLEPLVEKCKKYIKALSNQITN
jgi:hypothetical protein